MSGLDYKSAKVDEIPAFRSDEAGLALRRDWTLEEERRAKRKLDFIIMPLLTLGFFYLQLDQGNIANALTDRFLRDVGITQNQFNVGQQMLSLGIVLFEIPSNMVLCRVGPGKWLALQIFLFGTVSTFQAFQNNHGFFIASRLLLGITESEFIPGGLWTLSTWVIMGANIAGIYGAQLFRSDDSPRYRRAFAVACAILAFGLILAIIRWVDDIRRRRILSRNAISEAPSDQDRISITDDKEALAVPPSEV